MLHSPRLLVAGLPAILVLAAIPAACQSGGVGDPCTPEDEYGASFSGFDIAVGYVESGSFQCATRICLVNHFQGRVSCPLGQSPADIQRCTGPDDTSCPSGTRCERSATLTPPCNACDPASDPSCVPQMCPAGLTCDPALGVCTCDSTNSPTLKLEGATYGCGYLDPACTPSRDHPCFGLLRSYVCHAPGSCQTAGAATADNQGKACCVPGTDAPVDVPVCGQCASEGRRDAASAVYCSCRCGVADGDPPEPDFNFCTCPGGFTCSEIRPDFGLTGADKQLNGRYCIKEGSAFTNTAACGLAAGYNGSACVGLAVP